MPITRLSLDGYGARRAGSFAGKALALVQVLEPLAATLTMRMALIQDLRMTQAASGTLRMHQSVNNDVVI